MTTRKPVTPEEALHALSTVGEDPSADRGAIIATLLEPSPMPIDESRGYFVQEAVQSLRTRADTLAASHTRFEQAYDAHFEAGRYHGDANWAFRTLLEDLLEWNSRWRVGSLAAAEFHQASPNAKKLFFFEFIAPRLEAAGYPVPGQAEAADTVKRACNELFGTPTEKRGANVYATLAEFERDYEPFGETARLAMVYAGMGERHETHHRSLAQLIGAINEDARHAMRLDPARNYAANHYSHLRVIALRIETELKEDLALLKAVRGPWAAKLFDQFDDGGEFMTYPHLARDTIKQFATRSKGYLLRVIARAATEPVASLAHRAEDEPGHPLTKASSKHAHLMHAEREGAALQLMARVRHRESEERERALEEQRAEDEEKEDEAWLEITELVLEMSAHDLGVLIAQFEHAQGEGVSLAAIPGAAARALMEQFSPSTVIDADVVGFFAQLGLVPAACVDPAASPEQWLTDEVVEHARKLLLRSAVARPSTPVKTGEPPPEPVESDPCEL